MKVISTNEYKKIFTYDDHVSSILGYNKVTEENLYATLPDLGQNFTFDDWFNFMEPIDKAKEFKEILDTLDKKAPITVFGDYDCDGILATVICCIGLSKLGFDKVQFIIPNRFNDGYGAKPHHVEQAYQNGSDTVVTVDNGITCHDMINRAHQLNMKVLITDHHNPDGDNEGDIVVNPHYNSDNFKDISGATVMFKVIYYLFKEYGINDSCIYDLAALAGITAISDVMSMTGENRILYKAMVNYCNKQGSIEGSFINKLSELIGFTRRGIEKGSKIPKDFNKTTIDFYLAPVINAMNRVLGDVSYLVEDIIELFYGESSAEPGYYAKINNERKEMKKILLESHVEDPLHNVAVEALKPPYGSNYSGIVGLVASSIVEEEKKPAIVGIDYGSSSIKFSARSIPGYSLYNLLARVKEEHPELGIKFGGHDEALGCEVPRENLDKFRDVLSESYDGSYVESESEYFDLDNTDRWTYAFKRLAPFGKDFKLPQFYKKGTVLFVDLQARGFKLKFTGNEFIKCFPTADLDYLLFCCSKENPIEVEVIVELCYDENGEIGWKLVKILNKKEEILKKVEEKRKYSGYGY